MSKEPPPCGTYPAYRRGCRCEPCRASNRERVRRQTLNKGAGPRVLAPCGTKAAKQRHRARGESCDTCAATSGRTVHECGTWQSRRRHKRNNETCTVCDNSKPTPKPRTQPRELAPCGTQAARKRHKRANDTVCDTCWPTRKTPAPRTLQPCGTIAAAKRHRYSGEPVCEPCLTAERDRATYERRQRGIPERLTLQELIDEARFLLNAGEGEARILQATGYTGRAGTLRARLTQAGHHQLANQILNPWDLAA